MAILLDFEESMNCGPLEYCLFKHFREGSCSRNFAVAEFRENKPSQNGKHTLPFIDVGKSCSNRDF